MDINIEALSIQLHDTSSFQTSIEFFINSSDDEEKTNLPMLEELALGTLTKRITELRKVYKIKGRFKIKLKRRKIQMEFSGLKWNLERWVLVVHKWQ